MTSRGLFWHRRDLRFSDNLTLAKAAAETPALTGVFFFDPECHSLKGKPSLAPAQRWFLFESLVELQQRWQNAGSRLLLFQGHAFQLLPRLAVALKIELVAWNRDLEPWARAQDREVARVLQSAGRKVLVDWDHLLLSPEVVQTDGGSPYRVYGPFLKKWRTRIQERRPITIQTPKTLKDLRSDEISALSKGELLGDLLVKCVARPPSDHGFQGVNLCPCRPGESAAQRQLQAFCDEGALLNYEQGRNIPGDEGTSALGAAFRFGTLSPRQAWSSAQSARVLARSEEELRSIQIWEQELVWREFYQHALFHFPELVNGPYRSSWLHFPWENNQQWFEAWRDGLTGIPIVDASMRQLQLSGWMHNRCRMIVASFLVKDLICDWQLGEKTFMEHLVDGDLAANNGGWQWSASSGMDPKPLRIFNPSIQAAKFDAEASYIRYWLPEIAHISTDDLIRGDIPALERRGYPEPLVNHKHQQARFKALYAGIRNQ